MKQIKTNTGTASRLPLFPLIATLVLLLSIPGLSFAASAKDTKKQIAAPSATQKPTKKVGPSTIAPQSTTMMGGSVTDHLPRVTIDYFNQKFDVAPGTMMATGPLGRSEAPDSAGIALGESITITWGIKGCNVEGVTAYLNGGNINAGRQHHVTSDGCDYYKDERTYSPTTDTTYTLEAKGRIAGGGEVRATKTFTVRVLRPAFELIEPEVNPNTRDITLIIRNSGGADFGPAVIDVHYSIDGVDGGSYVPVKSGLLTTEPISIARGRRAELGVISLGSQKARALAYDSIRIGMNAGTSVEGIGRKGGMFTHEWERHTYTIDNSAMTGLSILSSYDVRLNNYGGGVHPHVPNDCHITLNLMGTESAQNFNLEPYVEQVLVAVAPSPVPINQDVAVYVNQITASQRGSSTLFSVRDGKLVIHVDFPNSGSQEVKIGFHNWGSNDEFRDNAVADVELGPFSVDILLTPELRGGKVSYGRVEVEAHGISASMVGALDDLLNSSGMVQRFLNNTLKNYIVSYLTSTMDSNGTRTAFERGIESGLSIFGGITRVTSVRGSGNTIIVEYL